MTAQALEELCAADTLRSDTANDRTVGVDPYAQCIRDPEAAVGRAQAEASPQVSPYLERRVRTLEEVLRRRGARGGEDR